MVVVVVVVSVTVALGDVGVSPLQPMSWMVPTALPKRAAMRSQRRRPISAPVARRSRCSPPKSSWSS